MLCFDNKELCVSILIVFKKKFLLIFYLFAKNVVFLYAAKLLCPHCASASQIHISAMHQKMSLVWIWRDLISLNCPNYFFLLYFIFMELCNGSVVFADKSWQISWHRRHLIWDILSFTFMQIKNSFSVRFSAYEYKKKIVCSMFSHVMLRIP